MSVKHRCGFCRKILRENGTCANPDCPRYVPDEPETTKKTPEETTEQGGE